jgi:two-component system cell cycle response regulator DivK
MTYPNDWRQMPNNGREPDQSHGPDRAPGGDDLPTEARPTAPGVSGWPAPHPAAAPAAPATPPPALDALDDPGQTQPGLSAVRPNPVTTSSAHAGPFQPQPPKSGALRNPPHAAGAASQAPGAFWHQPRRHGAIKLLIVENELSNLRLMVDTLKLAGYQCVSASNGAAALTVFERERPDLVLTDIAMPIMDGLEAIAALRARPDGARIPVIGVSAFAMPGDRERALYGGCDAYVTKPYRTQELVEVVRRLLGDQS